MSLTLTAQRIPNFRRTQAGILLALGMTLTLILSACAAPAPEGTRSTFESWNDVVAAAQGQTVTLWMDGGDTQGNPYIDEVLAPAVAAEGIILERVPVANTGDALNRVLSELQAGRTGDGAVDLIWVNGNNFRTGKDAGAWLCGWTGLMPNMALTASDDPLLTHDFGIPVDGCEAPWNKAQFTFVYNSDAVADPPTTLAGVLEWAEANPGRFTYPAPPDFTGSAFTREVLNSVSGGSENVPAVFDQTAYDALTPALFTRLSALAPSLWRQGSTYPANEQELNRLFAERQIDLTMTYGPAALTDLVDDGIFPPGTRVLPLEEGTVGNASFLAIPANAASSAGAMVVANVALSVEQQLAKANPTTWGQFTVLDRGALTPDDRAEFDALPLSPVVPPYDVLARNANPELSAAWVPLLDEDWRTSVLADR